MPEDPDRRQFLRLAGSAASSGWLSAHWPALLAIGTTACVARDKAENFSHLKPDAAADLAAVAALIIPSDDTPGATEAGVIYFIDGAFDSVMRGALPFVEGGLAELNDRVGETTRASRFSQLEADEQLSMLQQFDQTPWFSTIRFLTVAGMFAMPTHGGNRHKIGWDLLGFDSRHGWLPPFGYYDAGGFE